jgi:hypothetical protein
MVPRVAVDQGLRLGQEPGSVAAMGELSPTSLCHPTYPHSGPAMRTIPSRTGWSGRSKLCEEGGAVIGAPPCSSLSPKLLTSEPRSPSVRDEFGILQCHKSDTTNQKSTLISAEGYATEKEPG